MLLGFSFEILRNELAYESSKRANKEKGSLVGQVPNQPKLQPMAGQKILFTEGRALWSTHGPSTS